MRLKRLHEILNCIGINEVRLISEVTFERNFVNPIEEATSLRCNMEEVGVLISICNPILLRFLTPVNFSF